MKIAVLAVVIVWCVSCHAVIAPAPYGYARHPGLPLPYGYSRQVGVLAAAPYARPVTITKMTQIDYEPSPQYYYAYNTHDALTGDSKSHHETRSGDVVEGSYSVVDPDGTRHTVDYVADPRDGFHVLVHQEPVVGDVKDVSPIAYYVSAGDILY